jgi:hypothetical protein
MPWGDQTGVEEGEHSWGTPAGFEAEAREGERWRGGGCPVRWAKWRGEGGSGMGRQRMGLEAA